MPKKPDYDEFDYLNSDLLWWVTTYGIALDMGSPAEESTVEELLLLITKEYLPRYERALWEYNAKRTR